MFPDASIPMVQMSLDYRKSPKEHYELAANLSKLRRRGVLVMGSGNMVHNLGMLHVVNNSIDNYHAYEWAVYVNEKQKKYILDGNHEYLTNPYSWGTESRMAIPTPEHYLPALYILATKQKGDEIAYFNDYVVAGSITMTSFIFGKN